MAEVLVLGALHWDVVVDAPRLPALDETLPGSGVAYRFGGKGGNQALAAARMGVSVAMAGRVGDDEPARHIIETLDRHAIDRRQVRAVAGPSGVSVAITEPGGDYGAVIVSGVNATIETREVDPAGARVVVLQNEIPAGVNAAVAARADNARLLWNAAPARAPNPALMAATDGLIVNRPEAAQMTGEPVERLDPAAAARALAAQGPPWVLVTTGADGGAGWGPGGAFAITPPLRAAGSAHGAGDAFVGALAAEIARGAEIPAAAAFAACAAAHFVATPPDARNALTRRDLSDWLASL